jgi:hypothetical protein
MNAFVALLFLLPSIVFAKDSARKPNQAESRGQPMTVFCKYNSSPAVPVTLERAQTYWSGSHDFAGGQSVSVVYTAEGEMTVKAEIRGIEFSAYGSNLSSRSVVSLVGAQAGAETSIACSTNKKSAF